MGEKHYGLHEAAAAIGQSYSRCWHAYAYKRLPPPLRVGRTFVLTDDDLAALKEHLAYQNNRKESHHESVSRTRNIQIV
ncbi:hypothetical protein [Frigoriglobus tundricola]|uniref:hypothetical protein n=1 Tax=Frigoriglobus tundricola TaxID=2774151 RepID=UPI00148EA58B|nr:hypothetical protein [Frigoriglobus tundricola]